MSSDYDFEDYDDAALEELDAIEASLSAEQPIARPQPLLALNGAPGPSTRPIIDLCDDSFDVDDGFCFDEASLRSLDQFVENVYQGKVKPVASTLNATRQTTLLGDVLPAEKPIFTQLSKKKKQWDHTQFAESGSRSTKPQTKQKGKARMSEQDDAEESLEFEQFPAPFVPIGPPPPMKPGVDFISAKHWIYPLNREKRDYQFNIVKHCLFDNTIVAIPTGLGKTFIAGCVMLNFYRWFPDGKVIFMAPTKPLVAQQIEACHQSCGIPGSDAVEITGETAITQRPNLWKQKRVFYMTPQTFFNELNRENCDAQDVVLLVIDEAHRATGGYSYNQVIRFMMAKNPHFRVLALTATPGSTPEAVQNLIDGLHISRIEIRDENSLDLRKFIFHKEIKEHIIHMDDNINKVKELLAKLMKKHVQPLIDRGIMHNSNVVGMHRFGPLSRMKTLGSHEKWAYKPLGILSSMAQAMGNLIEGTMGMCYTLMKGLASDEEANPDSKPSKKKNTLKDDPDFKATMNELELQHSRGFTMHPKMDQLKRLVVDHFAKNIGDAGEPNEETRAMIFVSHRQAVDEIVTHLNVDAPLLKATHFIGQSKDSRGNKGLKQTEQLEVVRRFKAGEFNILVATSIGEEGLDIGEVDLIVCYDAQKTPIRMLQRSGRTGRKRAGVVHVLLSEEREKNNLAKSKDAYKQVQKTIIKGDSLEFYDDVPRLLPPHIKPDCLERVLDIEEYVRGAAKRKRPLNDSSNSPKAKKRKRNDNTKRNIPTTAVNGFVPASRLTVKRAAKTIPPPKDFDLAGEDGESDKELEAGVLSRRTQSATVASHSVKTKKNGLRKSATMGSSSHSKRRKKHPIYIPPMDSDDSDQDMEHKHAFTPDENTKIHINSSPEPSPRKGSRLMPVVDITDSETDEVSLASIHPRKKLSWLVDQDDDMSDFQIIDSSPIRHHEASSGPRSPTPEMAQDLRDEPMSSPDIQPSRSRRKHVVHLSISSSPFEEQPRLHRRRLNPKSSRGKSHRALNNPAIFDFEAVHSGDEVSAGSSGSEEEDESDRRFAGDFVGTQVSPSYDQDNAYRMGLLTQGGEGGIKFHEAPVARGRFGRVSNRPRLQVSSSPPHDEEPDEYAMDSFLVGDEDPLVYSDSST